MKCLGRNLRQARAAVSLARAAVLALVLLALAGCAVEQEARLAIGPGKVAPVVRAPVASKVGPQCRPSELNLRLDLTQ